MGQVPWRWPWGEDSCNLLKRLSWETRKGMEEAGQGRNGSQTGYYLGQSAIEDSPWSLLSALGHWVSLKNHSAPRQGSWVFFTYRSLIGQGLPKGEMNTPRYSCSRWLKLLQWLQGSPAKSNRCWCLKQKLTWGWGWRGWSRREEE